MFSDDELKDFDFEELDNEIGLGELLKQKDNFFVSLIKKFIFAIPVILIGIMVFYASFTIGKVLFLSDNPIINPQEEATGFDPLISNETIPTTSIVKDTTTSAEQIVTSPVTTVKKTIPPVPKAPKETVTAKKVTTTQYVLIAGTFAQIDNAKKVQNNLLQHGFKPEIKNIERNGITYYRVIVAVFSDLDKATSAQKTLNTSGIDSFMDTVTQ